MPTLTIKNIPEEVYMRLKQQAEINRRSLNSEVIVCIEQAIYSHKVQPEQYIARARRLREKTAHYPITDDDFTAAKTAGRL